MSGIHQLHTRRLLEAGVVCSSEWNLCISTMAAFVAIVVGTAIGSVLLTLFVTWAIRAYMRNRASQKISPSTPASSEPHLRHVQVVPKSQHVGQSAAGAVPAVV